LPKFTNLHSASTHFSRNTSPATTEPPAWIAELKDSKKLSAKKREHLAEIINQEATVGLGFVMAGEIDRLGMSEALKLGARRAVAAARARARVLGTTFTEIVIDGPINFLAGTSYEDYVTTIIKADDLVKEVSAASIVAKQARDYYMTRLAADYPLYGFERHVGYGTAAHRQAIMNYGLCPEHRRLVKLVREIAVRDGEDVSQVFTPNSPKDTTAVGSIAEDKVASYLENQGHLIIARNFKTKLCEIDIISTHGDNIYFTEVKYRRDATRGGGLAAIDARKREKMRLGVDLYFKYQAKHMRYNPLLAVAEVAGADYAVSDWIILH
jgi:ribonuclease HII